MSGLALVRHVDAGARRQRDRQSRRDPSPDRRPAGPRTRASPTRRPRGMPCRPGPSWTRTSTGVRDGAPVRADGVDPQRARGWRCRPAGRRVIERSRFGALMTISLPSSRRRPVDSSRSTEVATARPAGHDGQDAPVRRPGLEPVFDDGPRRERTAPPADDRQTRPSRPRPAAPPRVRAVESQIHSPNDDDTEQEDATDREGDDRPAERTDHPARQTVASATRGDEQEHREDAAQQRQGQRPDEVEWLGERDRAARQEHLDDEEDDQQAVRPGSRSRRRVAARGSTGARPCPGTVTAIEVGHLVEDPEPEVDRAQPDAEDDVDGAEDIDDRARPAARAVSAPCPRSRPARSPRPRRSGPGRRRCR